MTCSSTWSKFKGRTGHSDEASRSWSPSPKRDREEGFMTKTVGPFSPWRRIGQTIATSGQIGLGDDGKVVDGGFGPELEQTLRNLGNVLADAGVAREQVIKVKIGRASCRERV